MNDISSRVRAAGVVGAGGAGFPTHVKLAAKAEIVLLNGAECEPLLKTDQQLAALYPQLVVAGLREAMAATGATRGIIALKAKYKEAIAALQSHLTPPMEIAVLPDIYPAGDEVMAIWFATGRRVPPGGIPLNIGVVVHNIQSAINIAKAVAAGEPVVTRTLTITGAVRTPLSVTVPLGTKMRELLELAGGGTSGDLAFIEGGPVMGTLLDDLDQPVTKTTGGLIALPAEHSLIRSKQNSLEACLRTAKTVCEQCSLCTELCPRHLIGHPLAPHLLVRAVNYNCIGDPAMLTTALTCSECGVCEVYACPVGISPRRVNVALKAALRAKGVKYQGTLRNDDPLAEYRLVPSSRLVDRLGLREWYREAPLSSRVHEPAEVVLKLRQHVGAPAEPIVHPGDQVSQGQLVAEIPEGALGARIHASIAGTVAAVTPQTITIRKSGAAS